MTVLKSLPKEIKFHSRMKHIETDFHSVFLMKVANDELDVQFFPCKLLTDSSVLDPLNYANPSVLIFLS